MRDNDVEGNFDEKKIKIQNPSKSSFSTEGGRLFTTKVIFNFKKIYKL